MPNAEAYTLRAGVASENQHASTLSFKTLLKGGNAVDAAVTMSLGLAVTVPHLGGLGGDFFALIRSPDGDIHFVNGSGYSPQNLTRENMVGKGYSSMPERGPLSITVPGMVDGLFRMWKNFGQLDWRELVLPVARFAEEGFPASYTLSKAVRENFELLSKDEGSSLVYGGINRPLARIRFKGLSQLLQEIAEDHRWFYEGRPAELMSKYVLGKGGVLEYEDFRSYRAFEAKHIQIMYNDWMLTEMPPNTQGLTTFHILKLTKHLPSPKDPVEWVTDLFEAIRRAYWIRDNYLGDPRYMEIPLSKLLDEEYIKNIRVPDNEFHWKGKGDTTFFITTDNEGTIVLGIQSLFYHFGSTLTEPRYQITLNSRASCFTLKDGLPNTLGSRKFPLHTLSAVLMENMEEDMLIGLGLSAGHLRPQFHSYMIKSIICNRIDIKEVLNRPRAAWEPGTRNIVCDTSCGDRHMYKGFSLVKKRTGVGSIIMRKNGVIRLVTDARGEGVPLVL